MKNRGLGRGLDALLSNPVVASKMSFVPDFTNPKFYIPLLIIPNFTILSKH